MSGPEVRVLGAGLLGAAHLTVQTMDAIRGAAVVFHLLNGAELIDALHSLNPVVLSLVPLYQDGALDLDVYEQITTTVLRAAELHGTVALVVMGHPSIYVAPTWMLRQRAQAGVRVTVYPALSSIDVILASMDFDIGSTGLQILDANRLVSYGIVPMRQIPMLVFQIGCFGSGYITRTVENRPDRLLPLVEYLCGLYPTDHPVALLECQMGSPHRQVEHVLPLAALGHAGHLVNYNSTLFVPPCSAVAVQNTAFQASLIDPARVGGLVR